MSFYEQLLGYYEETNHRVKMTYKQIIGSGLNVGFRSSFVDGRDFHQILQDIVMSVMRFHEKGLTNLLFANTQHVLIEYQDEIMPYYSDYIELRYILSGILKVEIEGEIVTFNAGEISFIDSLAYHRELMEESECMLVNVNIDKKVFSMAFLEQIGLNPLQKFIRTNIMKSGERNHYLRFTPSSEESSRIIEEYIATVFYEVKDKKPGYLSVSKGFIVRLMDLLSQEFVYRYDKSDTEQYNQKLMESITEFMTENLSTIKIGDLVRVFHFHPNYFNNLIKKHYGQTYSEYLIGLRIDRAKYLLETTRHTVDEVAWLVGYSNKGFFYRKFKENTGVNPAQFRESIANS